MDNNNWMQLFAEGAEGGTEGTPVEGGAAAPAAESGTQAHWQRVDQIYDGIVREAESLRELFPDLDLRRRKWCIKKFLFRQGACQKFFS